MTTNDLLTPLPADRFGRAVAARLSAGTDELGYESGNACAPRACVPWKHAGRPKCTPRSSWAVAAQPHSAKA